MDINNLRMPPLTDEEKQRRVADWKESERVKQAKEKDWNSRLNAQFMETQRNELQRCREMRVAEQVDAMRVIEAEKQQKAQAETAGDAATEPASKKVIKAETPRTRKTNLTRAINAAIETFGRKPTFEELWQFFQRDKDETGYIHDYTDTRITWVDTKGIFHDATRKFIANKLSQRKS